MNAEGLTIASDFDGRETALAWLQRSNAGQNSTGTSNHGSHRNRCGFHYKKSIWEKMKAEQYSG
jgi:hypothetical protein